MLSVIIPWIILAFFIVMAVVLVAGLGESLLLIIPAFLAFLFVATSCTIIVPPPDNHSTTYGYDSNYVYPPGFESLKFPWHQITYHKFYTDDNYKVTIPTQTRDGMRINYIFVFLHCKMDPYQFQTRFNHNVSNFNTYWQSRLEPTVDRIMTTKSEADVETAGGATVDQIYDQLLPLTNSHHAYSPHATDAVAEHQAYFMHIDDPQYNYACSGIGGGYCAQGDEMGLPSAPNRYTGQSIQYLDRNPTITPTPEPTAAEYTYIDDSGAFETQADVNNYIDKFLEENPSMR